MLLNFNNFENLLIKAKEMAKSSTAKQKWLQKRENYFKNNPNVNDEILSLIKSSMEMN